MIGRYDGLSGRIRQELVRLERVVERAEQAADAARRRPEDLDLYLDSAVLNLHDFYAGLELVFRQIAADVDLNVPSGDGWRQELLQQMSIETQVRPRALSAQTAGAMEEFLRFRLAIRDGYAFELEPEKVQLLVRRLGPAYRETRGELLAFADFLDRSARDE